VARNLPRPKPKWRFTEKTGKLERKASKGGIGSWHVTPRSGKLATITRVVDALLGA
jgi:hypothetical protein